MSLTQNLALRWRLLRLALTKRFVYADIVEIAEAYGLKIRDVCGDLEPLELVAAVGNRPELAQPDFSHLHAEELIVEDRSTVNWSAEPSVARFLGRLAAVKRAQTIFEIGCFIGWTTAHLAVALRHLGGDGRVHYVDIDPTHLGRTTANLHQLGLADWGVAHEGGSLDPAVQASLPATADLIFIDTTHEYGQTRAEISHYAARLAPGGCLVLHDSIGLPGVRRAVFEARDRFAVCTFATERSNGVSVLIPRNQ